MPYSEKSAARRANKLAKIVESVAVIMIFISLLAGLIILFQSRSDAFGEVEYPYLLTGFLVAFQGSFAALVVMMFACYIQAKTEDHSSGGVA